MHPRPQHSSRSYPSSLLLFTFFAVLCQTTHPFIFGLRTMQWLAIEFILLGLAVLISIWLRRPRSPLNRQPAYRQHPPSDAVDYVVVGAGPGGLAAARTLLERDTHCTVCLMEAGSATDTPSTGGAVAALLNANRPSRLPLFHACSVATPVGACAGSATPPPATCRDWAYVAPRPLRARADGEEVLARCTPYPQGRGLGGTHLVGWGLELPSVFRRSAGPRWRSLPTRHNRAAMHPLTWAFSQAMAAAGLQPSFEANQLRTRGRLAEAKDEEAVWRPWAPSAGPAVFQPYLYIDDDARRLPMDAAVLRDCPPQLLHRLHVLLGKQVADFEVSGQRVEAVRCSDGTTIRVRRGVVVAAGLFGSPALLSALGRRLPIPQAVPAAGLVECRDALVLPLLFKARAGVTVDATLQQNNLLLGLRSLVLGTPLTALVPFAEVVGCIPLQELGPAATVLVLPLPFGGRNPRLFYQLGIDRLLATYEDAMIFLIVLTGVEGLHQLVRCAPRENQEEEEEEDDAAAAVRALKRRGAVPLAAPTTLDTLPPALQTAVCRGFTAGVDVCRRAASSKPLCHLLDGDGEQEAMDYAQLTGDPKKVVRLVRLIRSPRSKLTAPMRRELMGLVAWARGQAGEERYVSAYIRSHTRWLGCGSGTSEKFLVSPAPGAAGPDFSVAGAANVVVGDCSAVRRATMAGAGRWNALLSGSISSAIDAGCLAAEQLGGTTPKAPHPLPTPPPPPPPPFPSQVNPSPRRTVQCPEGAPRRAFTLVFFFFLKRDSSRVVHGLVTAMLCSPLRSPLLLQKERNSSAPSPTSTQQLSLLPARGEGAAPDTNAYRMSDAVLLDSAAAPSDANLRASLQRLRDATDAHRDADRNAGTPGSDARLAALVEVQGVLSAAADMSSRAVFRDRAAECFKGPLLRCLADPRHSVAAAAIETATLFLRNARCTAEVQSFANALAVPALRLTASGNGRVAAAAAAAVQALMSTSFGADTFSRVVRAAYEEPHAAVRANALSALVHAMRHVPGTAQHRVVEKYLTAVAGAARRGVQDADPDVRHRACLCCWALYLLQPAAAAALIASLPPPTRKRVQQERERALELVGVVAPSPASLGGDLAAVTDDRHPELDAAAALAAVSARAARRATLRHRDPAAGPKGDPPASPALPTGSTAGCSRRRGPARVRPPAAAAAAGPGPTEWEHTLAQLQSVSWVIREAGLGALQTEARWLHCIASGCAGAAVDAIHRWVADPNRRVEAQALRALSRLLAALRSASTGAGGGADPRRVAETLAAVTTVLPALLAGVAESSLRRHSAATAHLPLEVLAGLARVVAPDELLSATGAALHGAATWGTGARRGLLCAPLVGLLHYCVAAYHGQLRSGWVGQVALPALLPPLAAVRYDTMPRPHHEALRAAVSNALLLLQEVSPRSVRRALRRLSPELRDMIAACVAPECRHFPQKHSLDGPRHRPASAFAEALRAASCGSSTQGTAAGAPRAVVTPIPPPTAARTPHHAVAATARRRTCPPLSPPPPAALGHLFRSPLGPQYALDWLGEGGAGQPAPLRGAAAAADAYEVPSSVLEAVPDGCVERTAAAAALLLLLRDRRLGGPEKGELLAEARRFIQADADGWAEEALLHRLLRQLSRLGREEAEVHHSVRQRAFSVLLAALQAPALSRFVPGLCEEVLLLCRAGMDDAFAEVQQAAARCVRALLHSPAVPADTCLNGLAACLERWLEPPAGFQCSVGWLEILNCTGRFFECRVWGSKPAGGALTRTVVRRALKVLGGVLSLETAKARELSARTLAVALWAVPEVLPMTHELLEPQQCAVTAEAPIISSTLSVVIQPTIGMEMDYDSLQGSPLFYATPTCLEWAQSLFFPFRSKRMQTQHLPQSKGNTPHVAPQPRVPDGSSALPVNKYNSDPLSVSRCCLCLFRYGVDPPSSPLPSPSSPP
eukprot:gene13325-9160_t